MRHGARLQGRARPHAPQERNTGGSLQGSARRHARGRRSARFSLRRPLLCTRRSPPCPAVAAATPEPVADRADDDAKPAIDDGRAVAVDDVRCRARKCAAEADSGETTLRVVDGPGASAADSRAAARGSKARRKSARRPTSPSGRRQPAAAATATAGSAATAIACACAAAVMATGNGNAAAATRTAPAPAAVHASRETAGRAAGVRRWVARWPATGFRGNGGSGNGNGNKRGRGSRGQDHAQTFVAADSSCPHAEFPPSSVLLVDPVDTVSRIWTSTGARANPMTESRVSDMTDLPARPDSSSASPTSDRSRGRSRRRRRAAGARLAVTYQGERLEENVRELSAGAHRSADPSLRRHRRRADRARCSQRSTRVRRARLRRARRGVRAARGAAAGPVRADDRATASGCRSTSAPIRSSRWRAARCR